MGWALQPGRSNNPDVERRRSPAVARAGSDGRKSEGHRPLGTGHYRDGTGAPRRGAGPGCPDLAAAAESVEVDGEVKTKRPVRLSRQAKPAPAQLVGRISSPSYSASPGRSVCAPGAMTVSFYRRPARERRWTMWFPVWSALGRLCSEHGTARRNRASTRLTVERLED